jgi:Fe-S-cluster containining protein
MSEITGIVVFEFEVEGLPWNDSNIKMCLQLLECVGCGHCCRDLTDGVRITYDEAKGLARHQRISNNEFYKTVKKYSDHCVMTQPCHFLKDNRCTVHAIKPKICLTYPLCFRKESQWISIAACPAGQKLIDKLLAAQTKSTTG